MFDYALTQYAFQKTMVLGLVEDLPDADLAREVIPCANHPAWILGHLALGSDFVLKFLGRPMLTPAEEQALYAPGSQPRYERDVYASKEVLLKRLVAVHAEVTQWLPQTTAAQLAQPQPTTMEMLKSLPTMGNLFMHLITTHEAFHIGQLSTWRRATGRRPLF